MRTSNHRKNPKGRKRKTTSKQGQNKSTINAQQKVVESSAKTIQSVQTTIRVQSKGANTKIVNQFGIEPKRKPNWLAVYLLLLCSAFILIWFSQNSINAYWQQTYHRTSPLEKLELKPEWRKGAYWQERAYNYQQRYLDYLEQLDNRWQVYWQPEKQEQAVQPVHQSVQSVSKTMSQPVKDESTQEERLPENIAVVQVASEVEQTQSEHAVASDVLVDGSVPMVMENHSKPVHYSYDDNHSNIVVLHAGDEVFFAGDSLMQGIAPHIQRWLKQKYGIASINLSKQSTGLSYPNFFDWPDTIEKTLTSKPNIKLLIVFLGPNDPWDFPNPQNRGGPYLKFKSEAWKTVYQQRIERILTAAQQAGVRVIWLGVPHMKANKLETQMNYLNQVMYETVAPRAIWLPTDNLLSDGQDQYVDNILIDGAMVRMRSKDGIHFSIPGQKYIAAYVQKHISYSEPQTVPATRLPENHQEEMQ